MSSESGQSGFSSILVATDRLAHADTAIEYGAWLAARIGAGVNVIHVIDARQQPDTARSRETARIVPLRKEGKRDVACV
jgi:nucleotide-binding universal stress UspA family protein